MASITDDQRLLSEQLHIFARNHIGDQYFIPPLVLVVGYGLSFWIPMKAVAIWIAITLCVLIPTIIIYRRILTHQGLFRQQAVTRLHQALLVTRTLYLGAWSSILLWAWIPGSLNNNIFLIMMNCGFIAATAVMGNTLRRLMVLEVFVCTLPAVSRYLFEGEVFVVSAVMTVFFAVLMIALGIEMHRSFNKTQQLQNDNQDLIGRLENLARIDSLTGINNRRSFLEQANNRKKYIERSKGTLGMAIIDVDHFKRINDNYGHAVGDEVLKLVASILNQGIRETDIIGRLGGEEFAILFMDVDTEALVELVKRLVNSVADTPMMINNNELNITISAGLSPYRQGDSLESLLERADAAMYQAKEAGRNQFSIA